MKAAKTRIRTIAVGMPLAAIACYLWIAGTSSQIKKDHDLVVAIKRRDTTAAIDLLDKGADPNTQDVQSPLRPTNPILRLLNGLHHQDGTSAIALLYVPYIDPEFHYGSPTVVEPIQENILLTRALLEHGASVNGRDWQGVSVLHWAAAAGHAQTVKLLLEHHANPNIELARDRQTPLWYANAKIAELLISHGANVNARDSKQQTPLWSVGSLSSLRTAEVLIAHGADVNASDVRGDTPLIMAATYGAVDITRLFYTHGGNVNVRDHQGLTPLMATAVSNCGDSASEIGWLVKHGAKASAKDTTGKTAVDYAARRSSGSLPIMRLLKEQQQKESAGY